MSFGRPKQITSSAKKLIGWQLFLPVAHSRADSRKGDLPSQLALVISIAVFGHSRGVHHHVSMGATTEKAEVEYR